MTVLTNTVLTGSLHLQFSSIARTGAALKDLGDDVSVKLRLTTRLRQSDFMITLNL